MIVLSLGPADDRAVTALHSDHVAFPNQRPSRLRVPGGQAPLAIHGKAMKAIPGTPGSTRLNEQPDQPSLKGRAGKDPLAAVLCLVEFVGPGQFSHFDEEGNPVGKPNSRSWVQIAAVSRDQPLALDTRVPTPSGWTTVGDLRVGDFVFDERGNPQRVQRDTEVIHGLNCFRLTFDDGTSVVSSASHGWTVDRKTSKGDRHERVTLSSEEIAASWRDSMGRNRIRIPVAGRKFDPVELPIDPYILGFWLGDGCRRSATFAIRWSERDHLERIFTPLLTADQELRFRFMGGDSGTMSLVNKSRHSSRSTSLRQLLREEGLTVQKFVPQAYLLAGIEQRRALLQGLIDSDGCVTAQGRVAFTNTNRSLIDSFTELAQSLGYKPFVRDHGSSGWIVSFVTPTADPVARLPHKVSRQRTSKAGYRYLTSVERVDSVPVKCIGIDTDSHLFQVESGLVTHNTRNTMTLMPSLISQKMIDAFGMKIGAELIRANRGRCRLEAVTSSYRALEGGRSTFVILNETHHWIAANGGTQMYEVVQNNTAKMNCRFLAITNAFLPGEDSVAERMRLNWELGQEGKDTAQDFLYDSIEAHPSTPLTEAALRVVIPRIRGDATWLNLDAILSAIKDTTVSVARSRRMWLNQIIADRDAIYTPDEIKRVERSQATLKAGDGIVLGFDGGRYSDSTALVAIRLKDRVTFLLGLWEKPTTWDEETRGRWEVDAQNVDSVVRHTFRTFKVKGFFADVNLWESYIASWSEDYGEGLLVRSQQSSPIGFDMRSEKAGTDAHGHLMSAIKESKVFYDGDLALKRHTMNARTAETKWGTYFRKESKDTTRKVDAYAAWVLAHEALFRYQTNPKPEKQKTGAGYFL